MARIPAKPKPKAKRAAPPRAATDPERLAVKGEAMLDLAAGDSLGVVAKRYSVPKATVQRWADIVKERMGKTPAVVRENDFDAKIRDGANKLIDTIMAHLDFIADRTWFLNMTAKDGGVDNVNKIRQSTGDQFIAIVRFAQRPAAEPPPSLPEIVDDESWSA